MKIHELFDVSIVINKIMLDDCCSCHFDELIKRLKVNSNTQGSENHPIEVLTGSDLHVSTITLIDRLQLMKDELSRTASFLSMAADKLTKRPYVL